MCPWSYGPIQQGQESPSQAKAIKYYIVIFN